MKAHKVPATYLAGWEIPTLKNRIYVFNKTELDKSGVTKRFRDVEKITAEHSYFMEEDFYYIDLRIEGIDYTNNTYSIYQKTAKLSLRCFFDYY